MRGWLGMGIVGLGLASPSLAVPPICTEAYEVILDVQYSGIFNSRTQVIDNEVDFCQAWDEIYSIQFPSPPCDTSQVDFTSQVAVVVALGERPNGCYNLDIGCVARTPADRIGVVSVETVAGPTCVCTSALVHPVAIAVIDEPVLDVREAHLG